MRPAQKRHTNQNALAVQPNIWPEEVHKDYILGKGSFGTVYKGTCRQQNVAIKILDKQDLEPKVLESFRREVEIMANISHPNIVLYLGACTVPGQLMIVTELLPRGDLEDMLKNPNISLSMLTRIRMAKDIAMGMNWLHKSNPQFVHRDLKTKNLLVDQNNNIKICDFGLSQVKSQGQWIRDPPEGAKGTPLWMAPEVLTGRQFDEKCDVYSYGIVLWCLVTRKEPYEQFNEFEKFRTAVCYQGVRPPIPPNCQPIMANLIRVCWAGNPQERPSFDAIIPQLDHILVDYAILDDVGRLLWKNNFLGMEAVPWGDFIEAFKEALAHYADTDMETVFEELPDNPTAAQLEQATDVQLNEYASRSIRNSNLVSMEWERRYATSNPGFHAVEPNDELDIQCLRALLVTSKAAEGVDSVVEGEMVTMERFGYMLQWFGPIIDPVNQQPEIMGRIRRMLSCPWYHGDITQVQAEDRLRGQIPGTFLVRFSSVPGCYTISSMESEVINHRRITHHIGQGYRLGKHQFPTLEALVETCSRPYNLWYHCSGSRFQKIFDDDCTSGYVQSDA